MITGVDFVSLPVQDMARAVAFYRDTLGLPGHAPQSPDWVEFELGQLVLALWRPEAFGQPFAPVTGGQVAFSVPDVKAAREALAAKGVAFVDDTMDTTVCHMAFFDDPDGNALMLHHRYQPEGAH